MGNMAGLWWSVLSLWLLLGLSFPGASYQARLPLDEDSEHQVKIRVLRATPDITVEGIHNPAGSPNDQFVLACNDSKLWNQYPMYQGRVRISFYADGKLVKEFTNNGPKDKHFLTYSDVLNNINRDFTCKAETLDPVPGTQNPVHYESPKKFFGIHADTDELKIKEGETKTLRIVSNVPLVCEHSLKCCLTLNLALGRSGYDLATISDCSYELCADNWNSTMGLASVEIPVVANPDGLNEKQEIKTIKFRPLVPVGGGDLFQGFQNVKIPEIPVRTVIEDSKEDSCITDGDPHTRVFERDTEVDTFETGDFILYEDLEKNFSLVMRTWPYDSVSLVCAVLARDGADIIRISLCNDYVLPPNLKTPATTWHERLDFYKSHAKLRIATPLGDMPDGSRVFMNHQRSFVNVQFHSGAELHVRRQHQSLSVHLDIQYDTTSSPSHIDKPSGICGVPGRERTNNKLLGKDGNVYPCLQSRAVSSTCINKKFTDTWRLTKTQTPFYNPPKKPIAAVKRKHTYCGCSSSGQPQSAMINCTEALDKLPKAKTCPYCFDVTNMLPAGLYGGVWASDGAQSNTVIDYEAIIGDDYDPFEIDEFFGDNFTTYTNTSGSSVYTTTVKLEDAKKDCEQAMKASPVLNFCSIYTDLFDRFTELCVKDYLASSSNSFVRSSVSMFNHACFLRLTQNPVNQRENAHGQLEFHSQITTVMCSDLCADHGTCNKGMCICSHGWEGPDCSVNVTKGAELIAFTRGISVCDVTKHACGKVTMMVDNIDFSSKITCKVELVDDTTGNVVSHEHMPGRMAGGSEDIECHLPKVRIGRDVGFAYQSFNISVARAGTNFSTSLQYVIVDSTCVRHTRGKYVPQTGVCNIKGRCYSEGARSGVNDDEMCLPLNSQTTWSRAPHASSDRNSADLKLEGPDASLMMTCIVGANLNGHDREVSWLVNAVERFSERLQPGDTKSTRSMLDLWKSDPIFLQCRMKVLASDGHTQLGHTLISNELTIS